jgi:hypothetical protein
MHGLAVQKARSILYVARVHGEPRSVHDARQQREHGWAPCGVRVGVTFYGPVWRPCGGGLFF